MSYPPQPFTICSIRPSAFHAALLPAIEDLYHPQRGAPHCPAGTEAMLADPLLHLSPVSTQEIEQLQHVATTVDQHCPILTPNIIYKAIDAIDAIGTMCPCPSFLFRICVDVRTSWATSQSSSAFLTPTFRAEPADSCDGTCTSSRIRILRGFSTANSAPRWWTTNHHQGGIAYICLCHLYPFVIIYLLVKTKKRGWFTILFLVTNRHQPVGKGWKRMKKVQSKKLLCHHVHDPIVQLSFTDSFHLTHRQRHQTRKDSRTDGMAEPQVSQRAPFFPIPCCEVAVVVSFLFLN